MITSYFKPKKKKKHDDDDDNNNAMPSLSVVNSEILASSKRQRAATTAAKDGDAAEAADGATTNKKRPKVPSSSGIISGTSSSLLCPEVEELVALLEMASSDVGGGGTCTAPATTPATNTWNTELDRHFRSSSFRSLAKFVASERKSHTVYPPLSRTFEALRACPLSKVKVVIVGQDPYHGPGQAHGLCFSVLPGQPVPPSLKNIYKELRQDPEVDFFPSNATTTSKSSSSSSAMPNHGHLIKWARQGVLLLNTVLTVRKGEANSHKKRGWEAVTDEVLRAVDRTSKARGKGVVFLLWYVLVALFPVVVFVFLFSPTRFCRVLTAHFLRRGLLLRSSPFVTIRRQ